MDTLARFRIVKLSRDLQKEFALPPLICADPNGMPFHEGNLFYHWVIDDNACETTTAYNYLSAILPFFTFLWNHSPSLRYGAPSQQIRPCVREYLKEKLGCVVRPHPNGNFIVKISKSITATSARLFLTALKRFYLCAILKGWYTDVNPLEWTTRLAVSMPDFKPRMPPRSGLTLPDNNQGRLPNTYFCVVSEDWEPRIIDDPGLRQLLLPAFTHNRDRVIARILFDSGARISEVLGLTLLDWRNLGQRERALTTNKGSHRDRIKEIWWSPDTTQLLRDYINSERCRCDPEKCHLDQLPDSVSIFVTDEGKPYTYKAFYANWQKTCARLRIKLTPHQVRHWYVTMALRFIESLPDETKRAAYRQSLVAYMRWRNPETLKAYDHHLHQMDYAPIHAALAHLGETKRATTSTQPPTVEPVPPVGMNVISQELEHYLTQEFGWEQ
ncbi:MAG: site-specific integrase [Chloroflexi bacterium]|nr:site-specific integrase [Chloroflexota bacterium]